MHTSSMLDHHAIAQHVDNSIPKYLPGKRHPIIQIRPLLLQFWRRVLLIRLPRCLDALSCLWSWLPGRSPAVSRVIPYDRGNAHDGRMV